MTLCLTIPCWAGTHLASSVFASGAAAQVRKQRHRHIFIPRPPEHAGVCVAHVLERMTDGRLVPTPTGKVSIPRKISIPAMCLTASVSVNTTDTAPLRPLVGCSMPLLEKAGRKLVGTSSSTGSSTRGRLRSTTREKCGSLGFQVFAASYFARTAPQSRNDWAVGPVGFGHDMIRY